MDTAESKRSTRWDRILGFAAPSVREQALETLHKERFSAAGDAAAWLKTVKGAFSGSEALLLQDKALESPAFRRHAAAPAVVKELLPGHSACAALLRKPVPRGSLAAARALLDTWAREQLPLLRARLGGLSGAGSKVPDFPKTILRNLKHVGRERRMVVSRVYFRPKRALLPPHVVILLDRSGSMGEEILWTALYACALYALPDCKARLFSFAEELRDLTALCDDPAALLLSLPAGGGTDIGGALTALRPLLDAPSQTAVFLLSDLRSALEPMAEAAAALLGDGVDLRLLLPAAPESYDRKAAARLQSLGAKASAGLEITV